MIYRPDDSLVTAEDLNLATELPDELTLPTNEDLEKLAAVIHGDFFDENPVDYRPMRPYLDPRTPFPYTEKAERFFAATTQRVFTHDRPSYSELVCALHKAYVEARRAKRGTLDEIRFEANLFQNLENLAKTIMSRTYEPSRGIAFIVNRPVIREIFAAPFRDRVVHHLLFDLCSEWWDRRFIGNSFACRIGKGTIYGWKHIQRDMRTCSNLGKIPALVQKNDLSGYFMSLDRRLLFQRVCWGLEQQFAQAPWLYSLTKYLWRKIIFDDPTRNVQIRGSANDWKKLPRNKSLFFQKPGVGIVIGNLTSQLLSNIFLDQLDHYVQFELGYRFYGRYVDDFYIVVTEEERDQLARDMKQIDAYLKSIGLKLHPKKCYNQDVKHGIDFLGARVYLQHVQPGPRVVKNFRQAVHNIASGKTDDLDVLTSYDGLMSHMQAQRMIGQTYRSVGWEYGELTI
ncbi:MAG: RNA-directed DNA polymerase [Candidatus Saccharibacteria bacterium]|nr:RNA-directed DNA polymerase [Candidatus Saccharibacteria bacterium]